MDVTDLTFEKYVLKSDLPVLVDFWADWCNPCKMLAPVVSEFEREFKNRIRVFKLDMDANQNTANRFAIRSIPSLLFFKKGRLVEQIIGTCTKSQLTLMAEEVLKA